MPPDVTVAEGGDDFNIQIQSFAQAAASIKPSAVQPAAVCGGGSAIPATIGTAYRGGSFIPAEIAPADRPAPYRGGSAPFDPGLVPTPAPVATAPPPVASVERKRSTAPIRHRTGALASGRERREHRTARETRAGPGDDGASDEPPSQRSFRLPPDRRYWAPWLAARFATIWTRSESERFTFGRFRALTPPALPPHQRMRAFGYLPPDLEREAWAALRDEVDEQRWPAAKVIPLRAVRTERGAA